MSRSPPEPPGRIYPPARSLRESGGRSRPPAFCSVFRVTRSRKFAPRRMGTPTTLSSDRSLRLYRRHRTWSRAESKGSLKLCARFGFPCLRLAASLGRTLLRVSRRGRPALRGSLCFRRGRTKSNFLLAGLLKFVVVPVPAGQQEYSREEARRLVGISERLLKSWETQKL